MKTRNRRLTFTHKLERNLMVLSNFFSASASLALVYVIQTLAMTQYAVRKTSEVENYMTSV